MNVINNIINRISCLVNSVPGKITAIPENELGSKPKPEKWSKKEILGHLCDSAFNNHSRFIRAQFEPEPFKVIPYEQNQWVKLNGYQTMKAEDIITLWVTLNKQIINMLAIIPETKLGVICDLGTAAFREGKVEKNSVMADRRLRSTS